MTGKLIIVPQEKMSCVPRKNVLSTKKCPSHHQKIFCVPWFPWRVKTMTQIQTQWTGILDRHRLSRPADLTNRRAKCPYSCYSRNHWWFDAGGYWLGLGGSSLSSLGIDSTERYRNNHICLHRVKHVAVWLIICLILWCWIFTEVWLFIWMTLWNRRFFYLDLWKLEIRRYNYILIYILGLLCIYLV